MYLHSKWVTDGCHKAPMKKMILLCIIHFKLCLENIKDVGYPTIYRTVL
uniref:Uncharacterized protein n=1 Tax=Anguilla anguilla TaxID=7936 RepID=A0A0E9Q6B5_ANGAN